MFSAYKITGDYNAGNFIIDYSKFLINYGNSFDLETGTFTTPRQGIFEFFVSMHHHNCGLRSELLVMKNRVKELWFSSYFPNNNHDSLSFSWIMELQQGDIVQLQVESGCFDCNDSVAGCIFNGKLIQQI